MEQAQTNWGQSVTGVVIRGDRVLLARHTYGGGAGQLIIPGGYVNVGETPQDALKREFMEETGVVVEPREVIGVRFNMHDWYIAFRAEYVSGEAVSDQNENSEVLWVDVQEALRREDVPMLTRKLIASAMAPGRGLHHEPYEANTKNAPYSLYCL